MLRFWRNPLLILHVRSDLRPARAATAAAVSLIVCILIAMGCWSGNNGNAPGILAGLLRMVGGRSVCAAGSLVRGHVRAGGGAGKGIEDV